MLTAPPQGPTPPPVHKVKDLADAWELHPKSIYAMIADGRLHAFKAGRHLLITDESVQALARAAA